MMHHLISVTQAANMSNVHPATIRRMIARGELPAVRIGRVWRVNPSDLQPERREVPGTPTIKGARVVTGRLSQLAQLGSTQQQAGA